MNILKKLTALENEASDFGFRWDNSNQIMEQIQSECAEINVHLKCVAEPEVKTELQEEIGDLLHAIFSLCVFCKLDPEETLEKSTLKFERRFKKVMQLAQEEGFTTLEGHSFEERMRFWDQAKNQLNNLD